MDRTNKFLPQVIKIQCVNTIIIFCVFKVTRVTDITITMLRRERPLAFNFPILLAEVERCMELISSFMSWNIHFSDVLPFIAEDNLSAYASYKINIHKINKHSHYRIFVCWLLFVLSFIYFFTY